MGVVTVPSRRVLACGFATVIAIVVMSGCAVRRPEAEPIDWQAPVAREHPLVGTVYDVDAARVITLDDLIASAATADVLLLGEQHDNIDHHRLQTRVLQAVVDAGRRPAVAFEQLDFEDQPAVDAALARPSRTTEEKAADLATAVDWDHSGWPAFELYEPLFALALDNGLRVRAANLSRDALEKQLSTPGGPSPLARLPAAHRSAMEAEIVESHCGHATKGLATAMIDMQRRRDLAMADAVLEAVGSRAGGSAEPVAGAADGAVLVCGFGHARDDFGVGALLRARRPGLRVLSVGFVEVQPELLTLAGYGAAIHSAAPEVLPFDFVVFTPRMDAEDPCEKFRPSLEKLKGR